MDRFKKLSILYKIEIIVSILAVLFILIVPFIFTIFSGLKGTIGYYIFCFILGVISIIWLCTTLLTFFKLLLLAVSKVTISIKRDNRGNFKKKRKKKVKRQLD